MDRAEVLRAHGRASLWRREFLSGLPGLLVGQAAPRNPAHGSRHALFPFPRNCAGERLWRMSGWELMEWFALWDRVNTIREWPGASPSGKGDSFPLPLAREQAQHLFARERLWARTVVFVGKANAQCYGWDAERLPEPLRLHPQRGGGTWAWVPHTSGVVPFWNDPGNRDQLRGLFADLRKLFSQKVSVGG